MRIPTIATLPFLALSTLGGCGGQAEQAPASTSAASAAAATATDDPRAAILGTWESLEGEVRPAQGGGKLYLRRKFTFEPDTSSAYFRFYADDTFTTETMTVEFGGGYTILGPSARVAGATEGNFPLSWLRITPRVDGAAQFLSSAPAGSCGTAPWQVGVAQDLAATNGCVLFGIDTRSTTEHDIFKVEDGKLFFGARPADGSLLDDPAKRPTSWQVPLRRAP